MTTTGTVDRPGARVFFTDTGGDGPAVVLMHGAGMDSSTFAPQVDALHGAGYRVVSSDLRGHGASALATGAPRFTAADALDDLTALLDARRIDRPVLAGHSLGGNLAQAFARRDPSRVRGLAIVGATWNAGPVGPLERLALRLAAPTLALVPARRLPGLLARASAATPDAVARAEELFARIPRQTFLDVWRATASLVSPEPGFRSPVPLALVRGALDRTGNIATAMPRWADAEGIEEHVIAGAGHLAMWDAPEETSEVLRGILAGWEERGSDTTEGDG